MGIISHVKLPHALFRFAMPTSMAQPGPDAGNEPLAPSPRVRLRRRWAGLLRIDEVDFQDTEPLVRERDRIDRNDRSR
jgi:hypothetical protein